MLFADPLLAQRIERAEAASALDAVAAFRRLGVPDAGQAAAMEVAGGHAVFLAPGLPANRAVGLGMGRAVETAEIAAVEEFYRRRGAVPRIDLCPLADRSLVESLGPRGYAIARVFNAHVRGVGPAEPLAAIPEITVTEAAPHEPGLWARTVAQGFLGRDDVGDGDPALVLARLTAVRPGVSAFIARMDGEAAGGAALAVHDGLAFLFSAATRTAFRNRGVHRALLGALLSAASAAGCDQAYVATPPAGTAERTATAAGFRHAYTRMVMVREWS